MVCRAQSRLIYIIVPWKVRLCKKHSQNSLEVLYVYYERNMAMARVEGIEKN